MKERVDSTKMLREPSSAAANGPGSQEMTLCPGPKMEAEIKAEVKEEEAGGGKKSTSATDSRPPSRKLNNGDSDGSIALKSEDNNNKRIKLEKKNDNAKCENGKPGSVGPDGRKSSPQMPTTPQLPSSGGNTPATVMPNICHGTLVTSSEPPFMQQQSEIFVFSTTLANQATESVCAGQYKSIIQYHMDHPNTKAFLQKHPLKSGNSRMGNPQGMVGLGMKGQGPQPGMMHMQGPTHPNWRPGGPMDDPAMMGPGGGPMMPGSPYPPNSGGPRMMGGGWSPYPHGHPMMGPRGPYMGPMMDMDNPDFLGGPMNISSSQVPDENLTSEQRQHRSKGLAQLTKIHQMLMGGNGSSQDGRNMMGPDRRPHPGMYPGGPMMSQQQQAMMFHQQGMMPPHGMMSPQQHQHMMAQQGMPYGPRCPGPVPPGMNGKEQFHAQREWMQIQQDFMMEKQHRMQHMRGGPGPHMEHGAPPPSYYSSISQKHQGMGGPTSPTMNGMQMPMPPQGHMTPVMEHEAMGMYGPPHMGMDPMVPGMQGYPPHGMPPQGPMDPGFDPTMPGAMAPGISPGAPRHAGPMGPQGHHHPHMMGPGLATSPSQVTLHRAGNPEQFNPETMGGVIPPVIPTSSTTNSSKPPPSYAQAQKRKRDDIDDYSKGNLQHTPSPTKIHYHLNQFEGQELTITKQLNAAFVAGSGGDESMCPTDSSATPSSGHFNNNNSHTNSPLHGPGPNKGPLSNSSQTSSHMSSPSVAPPSTTGPQTPHSTGANLRLSHFDPPPISNGVSSAPQTPNPNPKGSSSSSSSSSNPVSTSAATAMSNITSASLANLAKGVENLSNQMQQNMMQGGPFHSIQMQGQMAASGGGGGNNPAPNTTNPSNNNSNICNASNNNPTNNNNNNTNNLGAIANNPAVTVPTSCPAVTHTNSTTPSSQTSLASAPPSVNNTYIATNMSISQVNIPNHPGLNSYVNMQMQSMSSESSGHPPPGGMPGSQPHPLPPGGPAMNQAMMGGGGPPPRGPGGPIMSHHMSQSQAMMSGGQMGPGMMPGPMPPNPGQMMTHPGGPHPPHMHPNPSMTPPATVSKGGQFTSPPLPHSQMPGSTCSQAPHGVPSPQFPPAPQSSNPNSSVQIQQKGHNTIQYLPANPPSSNAMANSNKTRPSEIDYSGMPRFPSPHPNMDVKSPASSTLQYFPNNSPSGAPRPPMSSSMSTAAAMGPEFANQANIAMQQSAAMMRSPSMSDMQAMSGGAGGPPPGGPGGHPHMPPTSMGPMDNRGHHAGPMCGPNPMMGGPDHMMGMGPSGPPMRPGHSPGMMRSMPTMMGSGSLECVSPIPGMGGYMNNGPSIEQAQAQAQAHAAMMMQGNSSIPDSSPHPPTSGPTISSTPHIMNQGSNPASSMPGTSPHGGPPMPGQPHPSMSVPSPHGAPGPSPHGQMVPGPSPHGQMVPGPSPHRTMPPGPSHGPMGPSPHPHMPQGPSPHGPMPPGPSPHGPMGGMSPHHVSMAGGGMPPHGHMGHGHMSGPQAMHGPHGPSMAPGGNMPPRHPSMAPMGMGGGPMGPSGPGQYHGNMQYSPYQPDFYHPSSRVPPHQMMGGHGGMMGGPQHPGQPYGMLPSMQGPS